MKIVLAGHSGSGKDHLLKYLINNNLFYSPKITTRPPRQGEVNGREYYYTNNTKFVNLIHIGEMKIYQPFVIKNDIWFYGISEENFKNNDVFILTPYEISLLSEKKRKECYIIYIDINEDIRKKRLLERNDNNDSVERRLESDRKDFDNFDNWNYRITDPNFNVEEIYEITKQNIKILE